MVWAPARRKPSVQVASSGWSEPPARRSKALLFQGSPRAPGSPAATPATAQPSVERRLNATGSPGKHHSPGKTRSAAGRPWRRRFRSDPFAGPGHDPDCRPGSWARMPRTARLAPAPRPAARHVADGTCRAAAWCEVPSSCRGLRSAGELRGQPPFRSGRMDDRGTLEPVKYLSPSGSAARRGPCWMRTPCPANGYEPWRPKVSRGGPLAA